MSNGKSNLQSMIVNAFGDYANTCAIDLFIQQAKLDMFIRQAQVDEYRQCLLKKLDDEKRMHDDKNRASNDAYSARVLTLYNEIVD